MSHEVPTSGSGEPRPSYCEYYDENHASWVKIATTQWGLQQADAEDVVQDAFKEARSEWEEIENPGAWMRQKIEWRASDCRKKNSRRQAHECDADADTLPTGVASTEERILARDRLGRLGRIISQLSEQDQRHVRLMAVHASSEDTAIALGMTPGTERARRCRLRKRLARLLHDAEDQK